MSARQAESVTKGEARAGRRMASAINAVRGNGTVFEVVVPFFMSVMWNERMRSAPPNDRPNQNYVNRATIIEGITFQS